MRYRLAAGIAAASLSVYATGVSIASAGTNAAANEPRAPLQFTTIAPTPGENGQKDHSAESAAPAVKRVIRPALLIDSASEQGGDKAFVDGALKGARMAKEELNLECKEFTLLKDQDRIAQIESIIQQGTTDVVAVGFENVVPVMKLAEKHATVRFTVIDGIVPPIFPNVQSIIFKDHEGAFLVGMVAAMTTKTDKIGFIGGMDVPLIRNFAYGYLQGAKYVKPQITVYSDMIGTTSDAWNDPASARTLAEKQYGSGADIVFAAAGGSGLGVLEIASKQKKLAIGVDSNQNGLYPGAVLTSMVKRVDRAVFETLQSAKDDEWKPGIKYLGVKESALDFAVDPNNNQLITKQIIEKVEATKDLIIRGVINVEMYSPK